MATSAQTFFDQIMGAADPLSEIRNLINPASPVFEDEWKDFKSGTAGPAGAQVPLPDNVVKETWSTALSGFGNTGGGVLVWGIDCRSVPSPMDPKNSIDVASGLRPVTNPDALKSRLLQLHHESTDPPVGGIRVETVHDPASGGYVVCLIPESSIRPHRALHVKNSPYYMRAGDDFVLMPTPFLRQLFFPVVAPRLVVSVVSEIEGAGASWSYHFKIMVENRGTASAKDLFLRVFCTPPSSQSTAVSHHPGLEWMVAPTQPVKGAQTFVRDRILHPGVFSTATICRVRPSDGYDYGSGIWLKFQMFAADTRPFYSRLYLPLHRLIAPRQDEAVTVDDIDENTDAGVIR
jgi:hypothetical protein